METRTYTAKYKVGDKVRYKALFPMWNGKPEALDGLTGVVTRVIFPGDIMYENWGLANGTGAVKYDVTLNDPKYGTGFIFGEEHLHPVE